MKEWIKPRIIFLNPREIESGGVGAFVEGWNFKNVAGCGVKGNLIATPTGMYISASVCFSATGPCVPGKFAATYNGDGISSTDVGLCS